MGIRLMQDTFEKHLDEMKTRVQEHFTPLARLLARFWFEIIEKRQEIDESPQFRKKLFNEMADAFMTQVKMHVHLLEEEQAYIDVDESYRRYCDTPYILKFRILDNSTNTILAHVPHTLYMYSSPILLPRILRKLHVFLGSKTLTSFMEKHELSVEQQHVPGKVNARTFLGWLLEEGRKIPLYLTNQDVLIIKTVGYLPHFENSITLNHAQRILRLIGLEKNTGQLNRYMARLNKNSIWRAKYNVNASMLGFETYYLPPIRLKRYKELVKTHPIVEHSYLIKMVGRKGKFLAKNDNGLMALDDDEHVHGIIQVPIYSPLVDVLETFSVMVLKRFRITLNLQYLHQGINEAMYPIHFDFNMIYEPTNAMYINIMPNWEESSRLSDNSVELIRYFSDPINPMTSFSMLSKATGIHRISIPRLMSFLVNGQYLYYFPLFTRIGMDSRILAVFMSEDEYLLKALHASISRVPRSITFTSDHLLIAYLSVGESQVSYLLNQVSTFPNDLDYYILPWASFNEDYRFWYNPALHLMKWHRREDKLIIFDDYLELERH